MVRFIHTADIHMGMRFEDASFKGCLSALRRRELKDTFHRIVKRAGEMRAHLLLIAGDLKEIKAAFSDIPDTQVIIVPGNHDPYIKESMYELADFGENVHVVKDPYEKIGFDDPDTDIYALGWDWPYIEDDDLIDITVADRSRTNILLVHGDIYSRVTRYRPLDRAAIQKKGFDYAALGHIHRLIFEGSYDRDVDIDTQEMAKELEDDFFYLEILDHAVLELDIERIYEENKTNIIGGFIEEMRKKDTNDPVIREAFQTGLLQLIQGRGDT